MVAPLHTETSIIPLQYRRVQLAVRYLGYLISLPPTHLAHGALIDSCSLDEAGCTGWVMDLRYALLHLPHPIGLPPMAEIDLHYLEGVSERITKSMKLWLEDEMESPI